MRIHVIILTFLCLYACKDQSKVGAQYMEKQDSFVEKTPASSISLEEVMGHFNPAHHPSFSIIEKKYADREGLYIHKDCYTAFKEMWAAAQKDGISLVIRSATRNFDYQKGIWERKWTGITKVSGKDLSKTIGDPKERALKILQYSSMPGSSRHHWGTDLDFNAFENSYFEKGEGLKIYNWLLENAPKFGFFRPYTEKGTKRPHGYEEEKWHWSYEPLSKEYMSIAKEKLTNEMISGFKGSDTAPAIDVKNKYILGVSRFQEQ